MKLEITKNLKGKKVVFEVNVDEEKLDHGQLRISWRAVGELENPLREDRMWGAERLNEKNRQLIFYKTQKLYGIKFGGILLEKESVEKMTEIRIRLEKEAEAARKIATEKLLSGETKITVSWSGGEILSGWIVFGEPAQLLGELGLAEYISGWGTLVKGGVVQELGQEFTYPAAAEYAAPARAAKEEATKIKEAGRKQKFTEAKTTGKPVELERMVVGCDGSVCECSTDILIQMAMPDGTVKTDRIHTH